METCKLCAKEYERGADNRLVCFDCGFHVNSTQARYLSLEQRLWGRCYYNGGCWEYGDKKPDGRPRYIMADGRQMPPAHLAAFLSGSARPDPLHEIEHPMCGNLMCVRPDHLRWVQKKATSGPMWAHLMSPDKLARYHEHKRAKQSQYQRTYRKKLRAAGGSPTVREERNVRDMERARAEVKLSVEIARAARGGMSQLKWDEKQRQERWDAMSGDEQRALLAQLPGADSLPVNDVAGWRQDVARAGRALGIPPDEANKAVPAPVVAHKPGPQLSDYAQYTGAVADPESTPGAAAVPPAADVAPEPAPVASIGLGALLGGVKVAPVD